MQPTGRTGAAFGAAAELLERAVERTFVRGQLECLQLMRQSLGSNAELRSMAEL
jgi:hypothetical protein